MTLGMLNAQETMTGHVNMTNYETLNSQIGVKRYKNGTYRTETQIFGKTFR